MGFDAANFQPLREDLATLRANLTDVVPA
jgi:hypothetical protein